MVIKLYKISDDPRVIKKTLSTSTERADCQFYGDVDVINPVFLCEFNKDYFQYNYAYFPEFGRYYFISSIEGVNGTKMRLRCHVDVLMTYADQILDTEAIIYKSTGGTEQGKYLPDSNVPVDTRSVIENIKFKQAPDSIVLGDKGCFVLTVIGGMT